MTERGAEPLIVMGAAGFVGHATAHRFLDPRQEMIRVDVINDHYARR